MMQHAHEIRARQSLHYTLDALHALPCGCVAAVYRTQPLDTEVVSLEARGPHCLYAQHQPGRVLGLSEPDATRLSR
jgi:hypothetical protein